MAATKAVPAASPISTVTLTACTHPHHLNPRGVHDCPARTAIYGTECLYRTAVEHQILASAKGVRIASLAHGGWLHPIPHHPTPTWPLEPLPGRRYGTAARDRPFALRARSLPCLALPDWVSGGCLRLVFCRRFALHGSSHTPVHLPYITCIEGIVISYCAVCKIIHTYCINVHM